jgi:outer membrane biosynthesis protein TonB
MEQVAALVGQAARDSGFFEALSRDPTQLRQVLGLTDAHMAALRSAEALAPRFTTPLIGEGQADQAGTGTLYPPEGSGTMALDFTVIPVPGPVPTAPPPLRAPTPPPSRPPTPPPPPPAAAPGPAMPAPSSVPSIPMPAPIPVPRSPPAPAVVPQVTPVQPPAPTPTQTPVERGQRPPVVPLRVGIADKCCCGAALAGIVALVSTTANSSITAITAIAGLRR